MSCVDHLHLAKDRELLDQSPWLTEIFEDEFSKILVTFLRYLVSEREEYLIVCNTKIEDMA